MILEDLIQECLESLKLYEQVRNYNDKRAIQKTLKSQQSRIRRLIADHYGWTCPPTSTFSLKQLASKSKYGAADYSSLDDNRPGFYGIIDYFKDKKYYPQAIINHSPAKKIYILAYIATRLDKSLEAEILDFPSWYGNRYIPILIKRVEDN